MADMSTLRSVLATEVETLLETVDSDYSGQVSQHYRDVTDRMPSRRAVLDVMGVSGNIKYAEVLHTSDVPDSPHFVDERMADGSMRSVPQEFQIAVWRQFEDEDAVDNSSQADWDALIWDGPDGLLHMLRTDDMVIASGGTTYYHSQPSPAQDTTLPLDNEGQIIAHYVEFTIEIND